MALYQYVKSYPKVRGSKKSLLAPFVSFVCMSTGVALLAWVVWPILSFTFVRDQLYSATVSPLSPVAFAANTTEIPGSEPESHTNANIWFPSHPQKKVVIPLDRYTISIPKLNIKQAQVIIGSDDLAKSLIHYGGTALPGEYGRTIIFGHSTLPQFYKQTDYKTIFSTLPTMKVGDTIYVEYDNITYRYEVYEMLVTQPHDLSPLEQQYDDSYLTLITCVPPGTLWERLNVRARLVRPQ